MRAVAIAGGLLVVMTLAVGCGEPTVAPTESTIFTPRFSAHTGSTVEAVVATIPVGAKPVGVAVNTTTNRVYVANRFSNPATVSVIDGATNVVIATIPVTVGSQLFSEPFAVAVNPTTNRVYVSHDKGMGHVSVIDGATNAVIATITVRVPIGVAVNPTTNRVYVTRANPPFRTSVIDGATNTVIATIPVGLGPGVGVNPTTDRVYVANITLGHVSVMDGATNAVIATVPVGPSIDAVGVNPTTNRVYVAHREQRSTPPTLSVIDGATDAVIHTIPVGVNPVGVAVNTTTNRVYVSNTNNNNVSVIATVTPEQATELLIDQVEALVNTGVLNKGQGEALIKKLEVALKHLDRDDVNAAIRTLEGFINQVNAFVSAGGLSQSEGNRLIDPASNIINALGG